MSMIQSPQQKVENDMQEIINEQMKFLTEMKFLTKMKELRIENQKIKKGNQNLKKDLQSINKRGWKMKIGGTIWLC